MRTENNLVFRKEAKHRMETTREKPVPHQTPKQELANSITHGLGAVLSIAALSVLVSLAGVRGDVWRVVSFSIYGAALILLYLASTFYHSVRAPHVKRVLRILDHVFIYVLIAGTYTPFALVCLRGGWGWSIFGIMWGLAAVGIVLKVVFIGRAAILSVVVYIAMGWFIVIAIKPVLTAVPPGGLLWLILGGLAYTSGTAFYAWRSLPYNHAVWHLFVLAGSTFHFFGILLYVLPA